MNPTKWRPVGAGKLGYNRPMRWFISWRDAAGKRHRLCYPTREIRDRARAAKEIALNPWLGRVTAILWSELLDLYKRHQAGCRAKTRTATALVLARFAAIAKPDRSDTITPAMCDLYFARRAEGWPGDRVPSPTTLNREHRMLSCFFTWAARSNYVQGNPIQVVKRPRAVVRKRRGPREREWLELLEACSDPAANLDDPQAWHVLILLGVLTGLRQSVLLGIRRADIDLDADPERGLGLLVTHSSKTAKQEMHGLPPALRERLAARLAAMPETREHLFPWAHYPRKAWERINAAAGVAFAFHGLRAAAGNDAWRRFTNGEGARQLSHSSPAVFQAHYADDELRALERAAMTKLPELPELPPYPKRGRRRGRPAVRPQEAGKGRATPRSPLAGGSGRGEPESRATHEQTTPDGDQESDHGEAAR